MSRSFDLDPATRFTAGAVGEPGARTFLVQARSLEEFCTLAAEKEQVFLLARELRRVIAMLPPGTDAETDDPPVLGYDLELVEPLEPDWRIGAISIEFDPERDRVIILLRELDVDAIQRVAEAEAESLEEEDLGEEEDDDRFVGDAIARIVVTRGQVEAMVEHAIEIVAAGRPRCPLCNLPLEEEVKHACIAMNGHRKRDGG